MFDFEEINIMCHSLDEIITKLVNGTASDFDKSISNQIYALRKKLEEIYSVKYTGFYDR